MTIHVEHLENNTQIADAHFVRAEVFQKEQGISVVDDLDGQDAVAEQFVAYDNKIPIGTARYRILEGNLGKVERVAVLEEYRGKKVGRAIMNIISTTALEQGLSTLMLDSQLSASDFYKSLGYQQDGEVFEEVGIPHVKMILDLDKLRRESTKERITAGFRRYSSRRK